MAEWTILQHDKCKTGGFSIICHNKVRNFEAQLLTEICNDVEIEPPLQPLEGEIINGLTGVNTKPNVRARRFWWEGQIAFFNTRITNRYSEFQHHLTSEKIFTKHLREKNRHYNNRIMNVELGTFTPLGNAIWLPFYCELRRHNLQKLAFLYLQQTYNFSVKYRIVNPYRILTMESRF